MNFSIPAAHYAVQTPRYINLVHVLPASSIPLDKLSPSLEITQLMEVDRYPAQKCAADAACFCRINGRFRGHPGIFFQVKIGPGSLKPGQKDKLNRPEGLDNQPPSFFSKKRYKVMLCFNS